MSQEQTTTQIETNSSLASLPALTSSSSSNPSIPDTSHLDQVSFLFGYPIAHSLSPLLHGTIYKSLGLKNQQFLYETRDLSACLALTHEPKFFGASVTMPFKVAIIPHLDTLTAEGKAIGAINTIFLRTSSTGERLLCGTNTDCIGIREAILQNVSPEMVQRFKGRPGMVIGGGGTCRAAVYAVKHFLGCEQVYLVNRDRSECEAVMAECTAQGFGDGLQYISTIEEAESLEVPAVVVSAIPDFEPTTDDEVRTRGIIETFLGKEKKGALLEMCYHPSPDTAIAAIATRERWQLIEGTEAMIWQGLEQDRVWLRRDVSSLPVEKVKSVIGARLAADRAARRQ